MAWWGYQVGGEVVSEVEVVVVVCVCVSCSRSRAGSPLLRLSLFVMTRTNAARVRSVLNVRRLLYGHVGIKRGRCRAGAFGYESRPQNLCLW